MMPLCVRTYQLANQGIKIRKNLALRVTSGTPWKDLGSSGLLRKARGLSVDLVDSRWEKIVYTFAPQDGWAWHY